MLNSVKDYVTQVFDMSQVDVSGAIDIVAIQHDEPKCMIQTTPFHVRFANLQV